MNSIRDAADSIRVVLHEHTEWDLSELYAALGDVDELTRGVRSLSRRIRLHVEALAKTPGLRVDELGEPTDPSTLAREAARSLADADTHMASANRQFGVAWSRVGRLYVPDHAQPVTRAAQTRRVLSAQSPVSGILPASTRRPPRRRPDLPPSM
ncbi:hypothetical protein [Phytoactinopolyspora halotolerans]|uniref:Uncharacterized protein n=1 Tax=Phytoactinopolyspora halotolerans TaxID=1981512 RepID=A0A6L9S7Q9_9ACTN|nr:hypothetical protein [Phytoactinopolyspora halotolerans]NEE01505.1 hypothetical protein [Phytoactinopolyspora halotolerans]